MEEKNIQAKHGLQLRKVGNRYMIVDVCDGNVNLTHVFTLNETAAELWREVCTGEATPETLAERLCSDYGIGRDRAQADVGKLLEKWREFGLIIA